MQVLNRPWGAMHYRTDGSPRGPALVFANSLGTDLRLWDSLIEHLPTEFYFIRYDKRGHGLSDTGGPVTIEDLAADAVALIEAVARGPAVFVGLSIGGLIGQALAAARPDLLSALVLSNTAAKIGTAESWNARIAAVCESGVASIADAIVERWFAAQFRATPALALWRNMLARSSAEGYVSACAAIAAADLTCSTATIRLPTLVVAGSEDGSTPPDLVVATAGLIPGAHYHCIEGMGHLPCVENPASYAGVLIPFLREHAR